MAYRVLFGRTEACSLDFAAVRDMLRDESTKVQDQFWDKHDTVLADGTSVRFLGATIDPPARPVGNMTPAQAAAHMAALEVAGDIREAIRFAHAYETSASAEDLVAFQAAYDAQA